MRLIAAVAYWLVDCRTGNVIRGDVKKPTSQKRDVGHPLILCW
jgi:hypothetical protein